MGTKPPFDVERLLRHELVGTVPPWNGDDRRAVEKFLRKAVTTIKRRLRVASRTEFDHYGSGYASYVDAWFYRQDSEFRFANGDQYHGLVALLSRLTNHFALCAGRKSWTGDGAGSSYLPEFEAVDRFENEAVAALVPGVESVLTDLGMIRLSRADLEPLLPATADVPTILSESPFRLFDAIFYWED